MLRFRQSHRGDKNWGQSVDFQRQEIGDCPQFLRTSSGLSESQCQYLPRDILSGNVGTLGFHVDGVEGLAGGHEEAVPAASTET